MTLLSEANLPQYTWNRSVGIYWWKHFQPFSAESQCKSRESPYPGVWALARRVPGMPALLSWEHPHSRGAGDRDVLHSHFSAPLSCQMAQRGCGIAAENLAYSSCTCGCYSQPPQLFVRAPESHRTISVIPQCWSGHAELALTCSIPSTLILERQLQHYSQQKS